MSYPVHNRPVKFDLIIPLIEDLFDVGPVTGFDVMQTGLLSENHRIHTSVGSFFLKRYRERINTVVHEIKMAEEYFAHAGLPIILPTQDRYGRRAFWCNGSWYSLYPFIHARSLTRTDLHSPILRSLSIILANLHQAGERFTYRPFQMIRIGNRQKLHMEMVELRNLLRNKSSYSQGEEQILSLLDLKERLAPTCMDHTSIALGYDTLLHGDYQHFNVFANDNGVTHVYDLERVALGPKVYELVRAIFLDCFEDGWEKQNFADAQLYLQTYRECHPLTFADFLSGIRLYFFNMIHTTWMEASYIIYGSERPLKVLANQRKRLEYLSTHDLETFAHAVFETEKVGSEPDRSVS